MQIAECVSSHPVAFYRHNQPVVKREEETREVWKYDLYQSQAIKTPRGSKTLCVAKQRGHVCVWMEVDPKEERIEQHYFDIIGTGWPIPQGDSRQYVGTVVFRAIEEHNDLVWHVYERFV